MCALMQEQLDGLTGIFERVVHHLELLGANVIIVQTVNDKCRAVEVIISNTAPGFLARVACGVVTVCPVRAVVAVQLNLIIINTVEICLIGVFDAVPVIFVNVAACAFKRKIITVCNTIGRNTLRIGVFIPACDACNRNDGLEALNAGRGYCKVGCTAVGTAGHGYVAV